MAPLVAVAQKAYGLNSDTVSLIAAGLLEKYGTMHQGVRGRELAKHGFHWPYDRKEEPRKHIRLITDRGEMSFGDLAILLTRASMAPVDKYFAQARRRLKGFDRGSRPVSGEGAWYVNAFYKPEMVLKMATIWRFYHNFMLPEAAEGGLAKSARQTPAMKIGIAKGVVYLRDILHFK